MCKRPPPHVGGGPLRAAWLVGTAEGWRSGTDARATAIGQRLLDGVPVVETSLRIPGGQLLQRVWAVADGGAEVAVLEVENRSKEAVSIALAVDGVPRVGVVSSPALGRRWWAVAGGGAWTTDAPGAEPRRIRVSGVADLEHASLSFQSIAQWDQAGYLDRLVDLTRRVWRDRAYGDMWSYMLLAEGVLDAVAEFYVKTYDLAALIPIVEEAGGTFTSVDGTPGPGNGSSLASNGLLHAALLDALSGGPAAR